MTQVYPSPQMRQKLLEQGIEDHDLDSLLRALPPTQHDGLGLRIERDAWGWWYASYADEKQSGELDNGRTLPDAVAGLLLMVTTEPPATRSSRDRARLVTLSELSFGTLAG